ncbi:hypothetical protein BUALT_Bualt04G0045900 [Buddleja alternifolia]|uniref:Uncharacterized protein n=1 Tax=Buddleja alternifolia TaxID=168488 RepID=A0AAV6XT40_9LAMI|nr:hypothetical protein BUALT_Bualt04G0045900 [Buddleja alternifolia]
MRRKGPDELHNNRKSTRKGLTHKCQNCFNFGHNVSACPNPTHPSSEYIKVLPQTTGARPSIQAHNDNSAPSSTITPDVSPNAVSGDVPSPRRKKKQSTYRGKGTYVGKRNDALLGKQFGGSTSGESTEASREPRPNNPQPATKKAKKASISEVLQNIKSRVSE